MRKFFLKSLFVILFLFSSTCWASVTFDGTDDYFSCGTGSTIDFADEDFEIAIKVKFTSLETATGNVQRIIGKGNGGSGGIRYQISQDGVDGAGDFLSISIDDNTTKSSADWVYGGSLTTGVWYWINGYRDTSGNELKIFVDGGTAKATDTDSTGSISGQNSRELVIGAGCTSGGCPDSEYSDVEIAEIYIWGDVLSTTERDTLVASNVRGVGLGFSDFRAYWAMDDEEDGTSADGDTFIDMGTNKNDCTGDDGANNTGLTANAETVISYP
jgi:hypothetical protein